jgi:hypothetical protein
MQIIDLTVVRQKRDDVTDESNNAILTALKYPYLPPNLTSGICNLVSKKYVKVQGKIVESYFNQINTFQNIGIKVK